MSDHEMNFASDSENAQDGAHPIANSTTRANLPSATHTSTEASDLLQSATPIGMVPLSSYSWPQPRGDTSSARERGSTAHRRLPAAIRAVFTGEPEDEVAEPEEVSQEETSMIDQRPGGGFHNADAARPKSRKMKWTAENDRGLLLFGLGRDVSGAEYQAIADWFTEKPTPKAIQERLTKLRAAGRKVLKESGIFDADALRDTPTISRAPSVVQAATSTQRPKTPASGTNNVAPRLSLVGGTSFQQPPPGPFGCWEPVPAEFVVPRLSTGLHHHQESYQPHQESPHARDSPSLPAHFPGVDEDIFPDMRGQMSAGSSMPPARYSSAVRALGGSYGSYMSFPPITSAHQQEEEQQLLHVYGQQHSTPAMTGLSRNAIGIVEASMSGTTGEITSDGQIVDELRRSEMELEAMNARWEARKHLG